MAEWPTPSAPSPRSPPRRRASRPTSSSSTRTTATGRKPGEERRPDEPQDGSASVVVGVLGKAVGLKGEVELVTGSDEPERLGPPATYPLPDGGILTVRSLRRHGDRWLIAFEEVVDRTTAERLRGTELAIPATARRDLPVDEWWPEDLVGLTAVDVSGVVLGDVVDVVIGGPQDRIVVRTESGSHDVPFVPAIAVDVDLERRRVVLDPPAGLL